MAILRASSGGGAWFAKKVVLVSTGVLSAAMLLKLSVPLILEFAVSDAPLLYRGALSWLRPPYLYILINFIIISIVASSKFQHKSEDDDHTPPEILPQPHPHPLVITATDYTVMSNSDSDSSGYALVTGDSKVEDLIREVDLLDASPLVESIDPETPGMKLIDDEITTKIGDQPSTKARDPPPRTDSMEFLTNWNDKENEKPPISSRFAHRKALKSSPEAKSLRRVSKPKRHDTMESTWRTITEGRAMPLARHLKKSDTWDSHARRNDPNPNPNPMKSETFNGRSSDVTTPESESPSPVSGKVRKEPSLSQDELNRRVEAFINKFNEEMRLQRQESLSQYQETMGRGAR